LLAQYHLREPTNVRFIVHNQNQLSVSRYVRDLQVKLIRQHAELPGIWCDCRGGRSSLKKLRHLISKFERESINLTDWDRPWRKPTKHKLARQSREIRTFPKSTCHGDAGISIQSQNEIAI
jgi:hypothetical protein